MKGGGKGRMMKWRRCFHVACSSPWGTVGGISIYREKKSSSSSSTKKKTLRIPIAATARVRVKHVKDQIKSIRLR